MARRINNNPKGFMAAKANTGATTPQGAADMNNTEAKNHPVNAAIAEASDKAGTHTEVRTAETIGEPGVIQKVSDQPFDEEKMAMLAFMNEPVTIRPASTTDKNAAQCFEININGRSELFRRGEVKTVKRFFVDRLMRLKVTVYGQELRTNSEGVQSYAYPTSTGLKYDFAIVRDDNPLGPSWERAVLAERG